MEMWAGLWGYGWYCRRVYVWAGLGLWAGLWSAGCERSERAMICVCGYESVGVKVENNNAYVP